MHLGALAASTMAEGAASASIMAMFSATVPSNSSTRCGRKPM